MHFGGGRFYALSGWHLAGEQWTSRGTVVNSSPPPPLTGEGGICPNQTFRRERQETFTYQIYDIIRHQFYVFMRPQMVEENTWMYDKIASRHVRDHGVDGVTCLPTLTKFSISAMLLHGYNEFGNRFSPIPHGKIPVNINSITPAFSNNRLRDCIFSVCSQNNK